MPVTPPHLLCLSFPICQCRTLTNPASGLWELGELHVEKAPRGVSLRSPGLTVSLPVQHFAYVREARDSRV